MVGFMPSRLATPALMGLLLLVPAFGFFPVVSAVPGFHPNLRNGSYSLNWSGYAVTSSTYSSASGSWKVPQASCSPGYQYSSFWVGIDGFNSNTVEQTGTDSDCRSGSAVYHAWYEFYPAGAVNSPSSDVVKPGDVISATVTYDSTSNTFTTTLTDSTQGWTFTSPATSVSGAARSSAECIAERPSIGGSLTKLANFGTVSFGQDNTSVSSTCYANGSAFGSSAQEITIVSFSGRVLALPSSLSSDGSSFTVTWKGSN